MDDTILYCKDCGKTKKNIIYRIEAYRAKTCKPETEISRLFTPKYIDFYKGFILPGDIKKEEPKDICPYCGNPIEDTNMPVYDFFFFAEEENYNRPLLEAMIELRNKDIIEYELKMGMFKKIYNKTDTKKTNDPISENIANVMQEYLNINKTSGAAETNGTNISENKEDIKDTSDADNDSKSAWFKECEKKFPPPQKPEISKSSIVLGIIFIIAGFLFAASDEDNPEGTAIVTLIFIVMGVIMFYVEFSRYSRELEDYELYQKDREKYYSKKRMKEAAEEMALSHSAQTYIPKCPNCGSHNTKRISAVSRGVSTSLSGLASPVIGKQYECKNCGHLW